MWIQGKRREPLRGRASYLNTYRRPELLNPISWHALTSIRFWCFVFVMRQETPTEAFDTPGIYRTQQDHRIQDPEPNQPLPHLEMRLTASAFATQLQHNAATPRDPA